MSESDFPKLTNPDTTFASTGNYDPACRYCRGTGVTPAGFCSCDITTFVRDNGLGPQDMERDLQ